MLSEGFLFDSTNQQPWPVSTISKSHPSSCSPHTPATLTWTVHARQHWDPRMIKSESICYTSCTVISSRAGQCVAGGERTWTGVGQFVAQVCSIGLSVIEYVLPEIVSSSIWYRPLTDLDNLSDHPQLTMYRRLLLLDHPFVKWVDPPTSVRHDQWVGLLVAQSESTSLHWTICRASSFDWTICHRIASCPHIPPISSISPDTLLIWPISYLIILNFNFRWPFSSSYPHYFVRDRSHSPSTILTSRPTTKHSCRLIFFASLSQIGVQLSPLLYHNVPCHAPLLISVFDTWTGTYSTPSHRSHPIISLLPCNLAFPTQMLQCAPHVDVLLDTETQFASLQKCSCLLARTLSLSRYR